MVKLALVAALLSGCTAANRTALVASTAALACDWGQTRSAAANGWMGGYENNPIMGANPDARTVDVYFLTAIAANLVAYAVMPKRYAWIAPSITLGVQLPAIAGNTERNAVPGKRCGF